LTGESNVSLSSQTATLVGGALIVLAIAAVGRVSVLSWFLGAAILMALGVVGTALHASTGIERLGGLLAVLVACGLVAAGERRARRSTKGTRHPHLIADR
jgi:hypothetical protein